MIHFYKFSESVLGPVPARDVYVKRGPGKGWPEECPPLRAANGYGFDVLANFDMDFRKKKDGSWTIVEDHEVTADWAFGGHVHDDSCDHDQDEDDVEPVPLTQINAWFWEKDQKVPHVISRQVLKKISNQVKVSTYLYLATDPGELIMMTDIPNRETPWRALAAVIDTDWYPASYPWHAVLEFDRREKRVFIPKGTPICRLYVVPRGQHFAREMTQPGFDEYFARSQRWMLENGKGEPSGMMDITGAYVRQQRRSRFDVIF